MKELEHRLDAKKDPDGQAARIATVERVLKALGRVTVTPIRLGGGRPFWARTELDEQVRGFLEALAIPERLFPRSLGADEEPSSV